MRNAGYVNIKDLTPKLLLTLLLVFTFTIGIVKGRSESASNKGIDNKRQAIAGKSTDEKEKKDYRIRILYKYEMILDQALKMRNELRKRLNSSRGEVEKRALEKKLKSIQTRIEEIEKKIVGLEKGSLSFPVKELAVSQDDPYEDNDDWDNAAVITLGTHENLIYQDEDWYKVEIAAADAGKDLKVNVKGTLYPDPDGYKDTDFGIWDASEKLVAYALSSSDDETLYISDITQGWYYIGPIWFSQDEAEYSMTVDVGDSFGIGYISGRVTGEQGGQGIKDIQGIENVAVELYGVPFDWDNSRPIIFTDSEGYYKIGYTPGNYNVLFNINALYFWWQSPPPANYVGEYYDDKSTFDEADVLSIAEGTTISDIDAQLVEGGSIGGNVTDLSLDPIWGVQIRAYDLNGVLMGLNWTDENGNFLISSLPVGEYKIRYRYDGYATEWYNDKGRFADADILEIPNAGFGIGDAGAQLAYEGYITGRVTNSAPGAGVHIAQTGIENVLVKVYDDTAQIPIRSSLTDTNGDYSVGRMPTSDVKVYFDASDTDYFSEWFDNKDSFDEANPVDTTAGQTTYNIDAQLGSAVGTISGTVTEASTSDFKTAVGAGIEDVLVIAVDLSISKSWEVFTDSSGNYEIWGLPPDDYKVFFYTAWAGDYISEWYNDKPSFEAADNVSVTEGSLTPGIDAQLEPGGGGISGTVTEASAFGIQELNDDGIEEVGVLVFDLDEKLISGTGTDSSGNYEIRGLPADTYRIYFDASEAGYISKWHDDKPSFSTADDVDVIEGIVTDNIDAQLQPIGAGIHDIERNALIALYNSTGGDNWTNNDGWKDPPLAPDGFGVEGSEGNWFGITVENDHVTEIWLNDNNLSGNISSQLGKLSNLRDLVLRNKVLTGSIPQELGQLSTLDWLDLGSNQLPGSIPPELGAQSLSNLLWLYLDHNQLSGEIPPELGNLSLLQDLGLWDNALTGSIPPELGNLSNLEGLYLWNNQLEGPIPPELGNLTSLQWLDLSFNQLTGIIPPELGDLTNLEFLWLYSNQLEGPIPPELGSLSNLEQLYLGINQLEGPIPLELANLPNITDLDLWDNQLEGPIPPELGGLTNLQLLWLDSNQLTGDIPEELGNLVNLQSLGLGDNNLTPGPFPLWTQNLTSLMSLYFHNMNLTGDIPAWIGIFSNLWLLWLDSNHLSGSIPPEVGDLANLEQLFLNSNKLSGSIPLEVANCTNLQDSQNSIDWNALHLNYIENDSKSYTQDVSLEEFLNQKFGDWEDTQTVAPTNLLATPLSSSSIRVSWTPIDYTDDSGGYRVFYSTTPGGGASIAGKTNDPQGTILGDSWIEAGMTADKLATSYDVTGLNPVTTYYFVVETQTDPHGNNQNTVLSEYSDEVSAATGVECFAPAITTQPQSQTIDYNTSTTLTVEATGTTPFTYEWYQGTSGETSTPVGTNLDTYTTPNLTQTTSYWVRVTNSCGSDDSDTATISITLVATNISEFSGNCQSQSGESADVKIKTALPDPFVVIVTDEYGNPVSGVNVDWTITSTPLDATGQSLSAPPTTTDSYSMAESTLTTPTDSNGRAGSVLTLGDKYGTYIVQATSNPLIGSPVTFTAITGPLWSIKGMVYLMFSIPYQLNDGNAAVVLDELGSYGPNNWRLSRYIGGDYLEYPSFTDILLGFGYWLISAVDEVISVEGDALISDVHGPVEGNAINSDVTITLQPGWNQVGCPFTCSVSWESIKEANPGLFSGDIAGADIKIMAVADVLWGYNVETGGYEMRNEMFPWESYWIYLSSDSPVDFNIPYPISPIED